MAALDLAHRFAVAVGCHPLPGTAVPFSSLAYENPRVCIHLNVVGSIRMEDLCRWPSRGARKVEAHRSVVDTDGQGAGDWPFRYVGMQPGDLAEIKFGSATATTNLVVVRVFVDPIGAVINHPGGRFAGRAFKGPAPHIRATAEQQHREQYACTNKKFHVVDLQFSTDYPESSLSNSEEYRLFCDLTNN